MASGFCPELLRAQRLTPVMVGLSPCPGWAKTFKELAKDAKKTVSI